MSYPGSRKSRRKRNFRIGLVIVAAYLTFWIILGVSTLKAEDYTVPTNLSGGGFISTYVKRVEALDARNASVRMTLPAYTSASTFYLGAKDVCVASRTIFEFHGPMSNTAMAVSMFTVVSPHHFISKKRHAEITNEMAEIYNRWPPLGDWFLENAANKYGLFVKKLTGEQLNRHFNVPICE